MRRCVKCGHEDWGFIHYCPKCGTLFPGEKEMTLVGEDDYRQATKVFGCIEVEIKKWNEMKAFYRSHLSTGYAPKGKQLIAKSELALLRKNNIEYEQAIKSNGTTVRGMIRCNVVQRHQKKINHVGFEDFWRKKIREKELYENVSFALYYIAMAAFSVMGFGFLIKFILIFGWWGLLFSILIAAPIVWGFVYVAKILDLID